MNNLIRNGTGSEENVAWNRFCRRLETERREIIQVWITAIMNKELMKYDLSQGNVFIKPLGKRKSNTTGHEYFNFAVVMDC